MIELPEAVNLAKQLTDTIKGKKIAQVLAGFSPHKFAFYRGDPKGYDTLLHGKAIDTCTACGGMVEINTGNTALLFGDGVNLRFHAREEKRPQKHQMLIEFEDGTAISGAVQMYGILHCFKKNEYQNRYYDVARTKPSPLSDEFNRAYFDRLIGSPDVQKLSAKAFLATKQRIPGLGNGVLQDILFNARIHPKRKIAECTEGEKEQLFRSVKSTLKEMAEQGGRDTEKDLFGEPGGYKTKVSQATVNEPCPVCGGIITKQPYMGGSIYFCVKCQKF